MITQTVDHIPINLIDPHDFSWLSEYGRMFCVFDQLISGNICFGVNNPQGALFIKYAGAKPIKYSGTIEHAVNKLKNTAEKSKHLQHNNLPCLLGTFETVNGFGLISPWFPGYALSPLQSHFNNMKKMSVLQRLAIYDALMDAFVYAETQGYFPAGIADQHILVNFSTPSILFSSVSDFLPLPAKVPYPKLPGSPWYLPSECYDVGFVLDDSSLVYSMGMLSFTFFGERSFPSLKTWDIGEDLFQVAMKAISSQLHFRQQTSSDYLMEWRSKVRGLNV